MLLLGHYTGRPARQQTATGPSRRLAASAGWPATVRPTHCHQAGRYEVVPYAHDLAWGQQLELLSILDLEEHCSYLVNTRLGSLPSKMISIMIKRTLQHFLQLSLQKLRHPRFGLGEQPSDLRDAVLGTRAVDKPNQRSRNRSPHAQTPRHGEAHGQAQPSCWNSTLGSPTMFTPGKLLFARSRSPPIPKL